MIGYGHPSGSSKLPALSHLTYRSLRRQHCVEELRSALRRWGIYLAITAAVAGVGAPALAAGAVLPLFWSLSHGGWAILTTLGYVLALGLMLWSVRRLLWPVQWSEVERQLPIPTRQILLSDLEVIVLAMSPAAIVLGAGTAVLLAQAPAWLRGMEGPVLLSLVVVLSGSVATGIVGLQLLRRPISLSSRGRGSARVLRATASSARHWAWALVWAPLMRGAAPRVAWTWWVCVASLLFTAALPSLGKASGSACLMMFSALALVFTTRLSALSEQELVPLHVACRMLPLNGSALVRARALLCLSPAVVGLSFWLPTLITNTGRPVVLMLFITISLGGWLWQTLMPIRDPAHNGARWLLTFAVGLAFASEVFP